MKRFYLCIALFVGIITFCVVSLNITKNTMDNMVLLIDEISGHVMDDNIELAITTTAKLENYWSEHKTVMIKFVRHADIDRISEAIEKLPYFLEYNELGEFTANLHFLKYSLEHLYAYELPLPSSFL